MKAAGSITSLGLCLVLLGPHPARAVDVPATEPPGVSATDTPATDRAAPIAQALHQSFTVRGGLAMPALKCVKPQRSPMAVVRPGDPGPAPAGSEEEELPLTQRQELELKQQALPAPSLEEIRKGLPHDEWLKVLHQRLRDASSTRLARVGFWGGSHMAAEFFVSEVRKQMQGRYGAGGAGHINLLYGLPGIRLPVQALCRQGKWQNELAPRATGSPPIAAGLGLFMLSSREPQASVEIDPVAANPANTARSVTVHYLRQPEGGRLEIWIDEANLAVVDTAGPQALGSLQINAQAGISRIKLVAQGNGPVSLLGAFADGEPGLVVDNFGIAGASGTFWTTVRSDLMQQAATQRPYDLMVLAYGTNDITGAQWDPQDYRRRFEATLEAMRQATSQSMCVLITPGDRVTSSRVRKTIRGKNGKTRRVVQTQYDLKTYPRRHMEAAMIQREIGQRYQCVTWDLSMEMRKAGGAYALMKQNPPWMARDLIHLTPLGYQEMAKAFLKWLRI